MKRGINIETIENMDGKNHYSGMAVYALCGDLR